MTGKSEEAMRTIGEVAESLDLPAHVLRFWETRFRQINPLKRAGGRRFYRQRDIDLVAAIRHLLYQEGYTIKGVQRILKEDGVEAVLAGAGRRQGELPIGEPPLPLGARGGWEPIEPADDEEDETDEALSADDPALRADRPDPVERRPRDTAPFVEIDAPLESPAVRIERRERAKQQARILREVLAELEECKRLLKLTKR
ncbi:MerR family transcriptional regulator [Methylocystis sp. B8]|uniref:MerR family transcriptional regulator n=1 Tax=Methylocystis sp. B8 TaxID=544938 RepID=UPI0010FD6762|nr:MerR family transcriptional regulator [Methylocystis sp. B8]TLG77951.1 MerR family transcriptional regulator [Methylocystis sp. B8]